MVIKSGHKYYLPPYAGITRIRCKGHPFQDLSASAPLVSAGYYKPAETHIQLKAEAVFLWYNLCNKGTRRFS